MTDDVTRRQLDEDRAAGRISQNEYWRRRSEMDRKGAGRDDGPVPGSAEPESESTRPSWLADDAATVVLPQASAGETPPDGRPTDGGAADGSRPEDARAARPEDARDAEQTRPVWPDPRRIGPVSYAPDKAGLTDLLEGKTEVLRRRGRAGRPGHRLVVVLAVLAAVAVVLVVVGVLAVGRHETSTAAPPPAGSSTAGGRGSAPASPPLASPAPASPAPASPASLAAAFPLPAGGAADPARSGTVRIDDQRTKAVLSATTIQVLTSCGAGSGLLTVAAVGAQAEVRDWQFSCQNDAAASTALYTLLQADAGQPSAASVALPPGVTGTALAHVATGPRPAIITARYRSGSQLLTSVVQARDVPTATTIVTQQIQAATAKYPAS